MKKRAKTPWFALYPAELMNELMALRDADAVYFLMQIRNQVLLLGGPVPLNYAHLGGLCGKGAKFAERIIQRLIHMPESDVYLSTDGRLSSRKAEDSIEETKKIREKNQEGQKTGTETKNRNKLNQQLESHLLKLKYSPIPYRTVPLTISNLKTIPLVPSTARGRAGRGIGEVLGGMMQGVRAVAVQMEDLDEVHLRAMLELYPDRNRHELLALFNAWIAERQAKGMVVRNAPALLMDWMKNSQAWLGGKTVGRA